MLEPFSPANAIEMMIAEARSGNRRTSDLPEELGAATLYVSSLSEVHADGSGFEPLLLGDKDAPLVAAFTAPERALLHRARAEFLLSMPGDAFFKRLPAGYGVVVNPGYDAQLIIDATTIARLRSLAVR